MADVKIYTTPWCWYCRAAKKLLKGKNVPFEEIDVSGKHELRAWLLSESGQRTVPQVFINGQSLGGFTDIQALDKQGQLDPLLAQPA